MKRKNATEYRGKASQAGDAYRRAMAEENYAAAMIAAGQCTENLMKAFLALHTKMSRKLENSHNAKELFTECRKYVEVKAYVSPLDLQDVTESYYLSKNPGRMKTATYSWEAAHTAGCFAWQISQLLTLEKETA